MKMDKSIGCSRLLWPVVIAFMATCLTWTSPRAEPIKIITSTTDMAAIARAVAGRHGVVGSICSGEEDPHFIQAKPSHMVMVRDADLWIRVGMDLEIGWERPLLDGARNMDIRVGGARHLDASEKVMRLEVPAGRVTRAMGDVHPQGNPHYWLDPLNARIAAKSIANRLCRIEPKHAGDFRKNLVLFRESLDFRMFGKGLATKYGGARLWSLLLKGELDNFLKGLPKDGSPGNENLGGWLGRMKPFRGQKIVVYHGSWIYFTNRFDLVVIAEMEPKPGIPPSPSHLSRVIETMKAERVKAVIMEPYYNRKPADLAASRTGARVVICPLSVGGAPHIKDYLTLMDNMVDQISEALQTEFSQNKP
ncbi:MAG: zinc ABC transporter substrate-binding protein [Deltaproteobacteria bacterium]|jgi:zinc/manganese transport system substrate-binding protein|nr:zinc ABC transporter substrate-binding protein [Deltaproteobacteria bacterium]